MPITQAMLNFKMLMPSTSYSHVKEKFLNNLLIVIQLIILQ